MRAGQAVAPQARMISSLVLRNPVVASGRLDTMYRSLDRKLAHRLQDCASPRKHADMSEANGLGTESVIISCQEALTTSSLVESSNVRVL